MLISPRSTCLFDAISNIAIGEAVDFATCLKLLNLTNLHSCGLNCRSWNSLQKGMEVAVKDKSEADEIKQNATR